MGENICHFVRENTHSSCILKLKIITLAHKKDNFFIKKKDSFCVSTTFGKNAIPLLLHSLFSPKPTLHFMNEMTFLSVVFATFLSVVFAERRCPESSDISQAATALLLIGSKFFFQAQVPIPDPLRLC